MSLSVIHFSDIHIKGENDLVLKRIDKIKAACVSGLRNNDVVVLAVSGDVAFSGKKEQYTLAKSFFEQIANYIHEQKTATVYMVFAPGNHDCNFDVESSVRKTLINSVKLENIDSDYFNNVANVQKEYFEFAKTYDLNAECPLFKKEFFVGESKIAFLVANTAWMSVLEEHPGKIVMPNHLFESVSPNEYKAVFYMFHHPSNWLNPDCKLGFIDSVRQNADIVLVGHEHARDSYDTISDTFSMFCNHGKELQDSNSDSSAFSILSFDDAFQNYNIIDFCWDNDKYERLSSVSHQFHKNIASCQNVYHPNRESLEAFNDIGLTINHFSKSNVTLSDLFVWPDIDKIVYRNEKNSCKTIRTNIIEELNSNSLNIVASPSSGGKTAFAQKLFLSEESKELCCLLVNGRALNFSDDKKIEEVIESIFVEQYSEECLEDFRQLPKEKRTIIVDDFDSIKLNKNRRSSVLNFLCGYFGKTTILISSSVEITTIITANCIDSTLPLIYYEILPLGNKKRKELIEKWYRLGEETLSEEEITERVERNINQINTFLGNGAAFIPAIPVFIITTLQNSDAKQPSFSGSKYGFLYESLIVSSLSKVSSSYTTSGAYNIDVNVLSKLAFQMLNSKKTFFTEAELDCTVSELSKRLLITISSLDLMQRMKDAQIIYQDTSEGDIYRFKYPYIFYYFCGRYIAHHFEEKQVVDMIEYMSSRLYNETYGNIIIFVCHFANSSEVIDSILINAYSTLEGYEPFDFTKTNPIFNEIREAVETLVPKMVGTNETVNDNKEKALQRLDEAGINDGHVNKGEETINDTVSEKEKDMAAVSAALKTIEVLGQILQNYPGEINGENKVVIIREMHNLGMRSVQAMVNTMGYLENDLVEIIIERATAQKKTIQRDEVALKTKAFINMLISRMVRGMVHQVAMSLNSDYILSATTQTFEEDTSISSKLVLLDLKLNCLNRVNYHEIKSLKKFFDENNERFASCIFNSIVGHYLTYNTCERSLRSRLCNICGITEQQALIAKHKNLNN